MISESQWRVLIPCEQGGLEFLAKLQRFLKSKDFVCELEIDANTERHQSSRHLNVAVSASKLRDRTELVQTWLKEQGGLRVNMEFHPSRKPSESGETT